MAPVGGRRRGIAMLAAAGVLAGSVAFASAPQVPPANTPPVPNFDAPCVTRAHAVLSGYCAYDAATASFTFLTPAREAAAMAALERARAGEGLPALRLPSDWASLTPDEQQFVLVNLARTTRGLLPLVALTPGLDATALAGARSDSDPAPSGTWARYASASNWAGDGQPAVVMYGYMYLDGWGGSRQATANVNCTGPAAPGCWAHRRGVLGAYGQTGLMGVATVPGGPAGTGSSAQFFDAYDGPPVPVGYTWAQALAHGAGSGLPSGAGADPLWPFADMAAAPWAAGAAAVLSAAGVVRGTGAGRFSPAAPVTLQEMATFLGRLLGWSPQDAAAPPDTAPWAAGAMGHAAGAGLLPAGVAPGQPLTRLESAALVVGALGLPAAAAPMPYSDLGGLPPAALRTLTTAVADGLLEGTAHGTLDAEGGLTRGQAVVLLLRALLLEARQGRARAGTVALQAQPQSGGRVLYRIAGIELLAPAPGTDPSVYWRPSDADMLAAAAGFWWSGRAAWLPGTPPAWASGADGFGTAVAHLWPAGSQGLGPALFGTTVQVITFPGETQELLPGASAWGQVSWSGAASDPARAVADAL